MNKMADREKDKMLKGIHDDVREIYLAESRPSVVGRLGR